MTLRCTTSDDDKNEELKRLSHFLQFLRQSPHIASEIHKLAVEIITQRCLENEDYSALADALCSLPQLRTLALVNVFLISSDPEQLMSVKIDHLIIRYPGLLWNNMAIGVNHLWGILALFGDISSVSIEDVHVVGGTLESSLQKSNVTALTLRQVTGLSLLLASMTALGSPLLPDLRSIDIQDLAVPTINSFLGETGKQYSYLGCSMPRAISITDLETSPAAISTVLDLSQCTNLRKLTFYIDLGERKDEGVWQYFSKVLDSLPLETSPHALEKLTLSLRLHNVGFPSTILAHGPFLDTTPSSTAVETKLLGWVEKRILLGVVVRVEALQRIRYTDRWVAAKNADFVLDLFPRLNHAGFLSLNA
ncbi:hypothetical protein EIP86_004153 [Pleurotus ostreatoroseus]|nr:hypothetical protein EIP86_004153 [Pleurotus ostreatoroseus]